MTTNKALPEILTATEAKGYSWKKTLAPGAVSTWMPKEFQAQAQADNAAIAAALAKMSKAAIKAYLVESHGVLECALGTDKAWLVCQAQTAQFAVLYPQVDEVA